MSCPYLSNHPSAPFEYAEVTSVDRETDDRVVVDYEGIATLGYPVGQKLKVRAAALNS